MPVPQVCQLIYARLARCPDLLVFSTLSGVVSVLATCLGLQAVERLTIAELFARNLGRILARRKLSQKELASTNEPSDGLGSQSRVSRILSGDLEPKCRDIDWLRRFLQVSPAEFFEQDGDTVAPLTARENAVLRAYRDLDEEGRRGFDAVFQVVAESVRTPRRRRQ